MAEEKRVYIRVPSSSSFLVTCNGQEAVNWRELQNEARKEVEPQIRSRWKRYRRLLEQSTMKAIEPEAALQEVMLYLAPPSIEYPCSAELAQKASF